MQQLEKRLERNTPTDASQVRGDCGVPLNKDQNLSVARSKTFSNNPEVNQLQSQTGGLNANVFVLSIDGNPLMPCTKTKARKLLKANRAKVFKMYPFTIQLNFECENVVQNVTLGMDAGFANIGVSCVSEDKELFSATVILDGKTSERLTERSMYRKNRRNKLWYREPRFLNRKKKEGWLPLSTQRRYDTHLSVINNLKKLLPISRIIIETANFDIAKIENPEIAGIGYQQGDMYGYQNMRSYLIAREKGVCQLCKKEFSKGNPSHIHHCKERSEAGSNRAKNLAILHKKCHTKLHKKGLKLPAPKQFKQSTFMSIIHKKFVEDIDDVEITFGYVTFVERNKIGIEKSHANDAFVIAKGALQERCRQITITQKHKNNRAIQLNRKGFAPSIRRQRYVLQPKDLIWIDGKKHVVSGVHNKGMRVIVEGTKKSYTIKNVERKYNFGTFAYN